MHSVQVKNVPDDVHAVLRERAAASGRSLQEYLLARLIDEARQPTVDQVLARVSGQHGGRARLTDAVEHLRSDREGR